MQMRDFLSTTGFEIISETAAFKDEGISHNFGRIAGRWDNAERRVHLTPFGRFLARLLSVNSTGHMLVFVVAKPLKQRSTPELTEGHEAERISARQIDGASSEREPQLT
jgi:hypothetical protein